MYRIIWHQVFSNYENLKFKPNDRTEKITIKQSISGQGLRVEFSNKFDSDNLEIISARVSTNPRMEDYRLLTLNDKESFEIPAKQSLWSDYTEIEISLGDSIYLELKSKNISNRLATSAHTFSDKLFKTNIDDFGTNFIYGITSVAVLTKTKGNTIAFFGDSLTNQGYYFDAATSWFFNHNEGTTTFNEGISGNRLLLPGTSNSEWNKSFGDAAVSRFRCLVNYHPDIVVILIGANDLYQVRENNLDEMPTTTSVINALTRIENEAIVAGIKPILVTLTPFMGAMSDEVEAWSPTKELIRQEINQWIRQKKIMVDLDQYVCSKLDGRKLAEEYDSGDHLHFSESGGMKIGKFMAKQISELLKSE